MKNLNEKLDNPYWLFWGILLGGLLIVFIFQFTFYKHNSNIKAKDMNCECPQTNEKII
jgi:hypothetical protein